MHRNACYKIVSFKSMVAAPKQLQASTGTNLIAAVERYRVEFKGRIEWARPTEMLKKNLISILQDAPRVPAGA